MTEGLEVDQLVFPSRPSVISFTTRQLKQNSKDSQRSCFAKPSTSLQHVQLHKKRPITFTLVHHTGNYSRFSRCNMKPSTKKQLRRSSILPWKFSDNNINTIQHLQSYKEMTTSSNQGSLRATEPPLRIAAEKNFNSAMGSSLTTSYNT